MQVPVLAYLVLQVALVGILDPLRQVTEEDERGNMGALEHGEVFNFHILALDGGGRERLDGGLQHVVELRGGNSNVAVVVNLLGGLQHLVDALLGERRTKDDGEVGERCKTLTDGCLKVVDSLLSLVLGEVPFLDEHDKALAVLLDDGEDVHVL